MIYILLICLIIIEAVQLTVLHDIATKDNDTEIDTPTRVKKFKKIESRIETVRSINRGD